MEPNKPPRDLTPEERLFRIIQEGEKSEEGDDTLVVSSGKPEPAKVSVPPPPTPAEGPQEGFSDRDIQAKKARRAVMSAASAAPFLQDALRRFFSIRTINRLLAVSLSGFLVYFSASQFFLREDPAEVFMKKASAMNAAALELPPNLFSVEDKDLGGVTQRNIFHPWKELPPLAPVVPEKPAAPSNSLVSVAATLKLSGIFLGDIPEALVEVTDEKKTYVVSKGMTIKGIQVKEVRPDAVILTDGQSEVPLR